MFDQEELIGTRISNYRVQAVLGQGSMGIVYLARDEALQRDVALKLLLPGYDPEQEESRIELFLAEARNTAAISHPNVVQIYHIGRDRQTDAYYIAMEYIAGTSVDRFMKENGPFAPETATEILLQMADGLHYVHSRGAIHRDVKPGNLLIDTTGVVKLTDFGLALTEAGPLKPSSDGYIGRIGTPQYMAPEVWKGAAATVLADIYSVGASYYQLLTGKVLYPNIEDSEALKEMHISGETPDPREIRDDIPEECVTMMNRCLAKNPRDRYRSAQELTWVASITLEQVIRTNNVTDTGGSFSDTAQPTKGMSPGSNAIDAHFKSADDMMKRLGFKHQPFATFPTRDRPYHGNPFTGLSFYLSKEISQPKTVVFVSGPPGSGCRTLCWRKLREFSHERHVVYVDLSHPWRHSRLLRRLSLAASSPIASSSNVEMQNLLRHLASSATDAVAVVAVSGLQSNEFNPELKQLMRSVATTDCFNLMIFGLPAVIRSLYSSKDPCHKLVEVPPLSQDETTLYINSWLSATRPADAAPMILTHDAAQLVRYWSGGIPATINTISHNMLVMASASGKSVLTSWEAWAAAKHMEKLKSVAEISPDLATKPSDWPTEEAQRILASHSIDETIDEVMGVPFDPSSISDTSIPDS